MSPCFLGPPVENGILGRALHAGAEFLAAGFVRFSWGDGFRPCNASASFPFRWVRGWSPGPALQRDAFLEEPPMQHRKERTFGVILVFLIGTSAWYLAAGHDFHQALHHQQRHRQIK